VVSRGLVELDVPYFVARIGQIRHKVDKNFVFLIPWNTVGRTGFRLAREKHPFDLATATGLIYIIGISNAGLGKLNIHFDTPLFTGPVCDVYGVPMLRNIIIGRATPGIIAMTIQLITSTVSDRIKTTSSIANARPLCIAADAALACGITIIPIMGHHLGASHE
jgi:hypothetical protein